ncbi:hypothetical protein [Flavobacterium cerinum]|uniref:SH3 domain-containing protein n=1 Tax=Flavobacterium cerinum TaxID=2502784 RepID=A0ABY5IPS9_9FLAO|nr:hypothetical protein [Flavobacterium cerinum]UUC44255.1 hypothetical protein NOX80_11490 [Flavobacterium cerinum]
MKKVLLVILPFVLLGCSSDGGAEVSEISIPSTVVTNPNSGSGSGSVSCGTYNGKILYKGSNGGCYYINSNGNKMYVDAHYCKC